MEEVQNGRYEYDYASILGCTCNVLRVLGTIKGQEMIASSGRNELRYGYSIEPLDVTYWADYCLRFMGNGAKLFVSERSYGNLFQWRFTDTDAKLILINTSVSFGNVTTVSICRMNEGLNEEIVYLVYKPSVSGCNGKGMYRVKSPPTPNPYSRAKQNAELMIYLRQYY